MVTEDSLNYVFHSRFRITDSDIDIDTMSTTGKGYLVYLKQYTVKRRGKMVLSTYNKKTQKIIIN